MILVTEASKITLKKKKIDVFEVFLNSSASGKWFVRMKQTSRPYEAIVSTAWNKWLDRMKKDLFFKF